MAIKPASFDPFDAPLWEGHEYFQSLPDVVRSDSYQRPVWIDPKHWQRHKPPAWVFKLQWHTYRYSEVDSKRKLGNIVGQNTPGIYIFSVRPDSAVDGFPRYAMYVGISNARDSNRPVRERLSEYLPTRIATIKKRKNIHTMLCLYYSHIWVHFAYVNKPSVAMLGAEKKLTGFLAPPFAEEAYPVDMKPWRPAW